MANGGRERLELRPVAIARGGDAGGTAARAEETAHIAPASAATTGAMNRHPRAPARNADVSTCATGSTDRETIRPDGEDDVEELAAPERRGNRRRRPRGGRTEPAPLRALAVLYTGIRAEPEEATVPTIIVGVDDSPRSEDAVALAGDLARAAGGEILAVCAFPFDDRPAAHFNLAMRTPLREACEATLERLCEPLSDVPQVRPIAVADPLPPVRCSTPRPPRTPR